MRELTEQEQNFYKKEDALRGNIQRMIDYYEEAKCDLVNKADLIRISEIVGQLQHCDQCIAYLRNMVLVIKPEQ